MAQNAKIFISSSAQQELKELRERTFEFLKGLGHDPQMYEKNFGPWPSYIDSIQRCLEKVAECDIFLLYIYNKAGSYIESERRTVTHLEFLEAIRLQKEIIVFVEKGTKEVFFDHFVHPLSEADTAYWNEHGKPHPDLLGLVQAIPERPEEYDDYIWVFLYDLCKRTIYFEDISKIGDGRLNIEKTLEQLKDYLSDMLSRGASILPIAKKFDEVSDMVHQYDEYRDLALEFLGTVERVSIQDWSIFIAVLKEKMKGGIIYNSRGYVPEPIGSFNDCSGITLYKRNGDTMIRIAKDGRAKGEDFYMLDDDESFVSRAYKQEEEETLFFNEKKKMLYLTSKNGEYVLSLHFKLNGEWTKFKVHHYHNELLDGILSVQGNQEFLKLAKLFIGGNV